MSANKDTVYIKIPQNVKVNDRNVKLEDIAELQCANEGMLRQIKQMKLFSFSVIPGKSKKKSISQVFSIMKVVTLIQDEYPAADVENLGEMDFVLEYLPNGEPGKTMEIIKTVLVCVIIFFGSAFSIMAFNNDISVTELFAKFYTQVTGQESNGITVLEISYSIGLALGILVFFNHTGKKKITSDPTPVQVEMRKYEKDIDTTLIENADRGGKSIGSD